MSNAAAAGAQSSSGGAPAFNAEYLTNQLQRKLGDSEYVTPDRLPQHPAARVVGTLRQLWRARTMGEICETMDAFQRHFIYDAPLVELQRKGYARVYSWLTQALGSWDFDPGLVTVTPLGTRTLVRINATVAFFPRRTFLLPATLLLPRRVEGAADIQACVLGDLQSGKIEWVTVRPHNVPVPPALLRGAAGLAVAGPLHTLEPAWGPAAFFLPWLGETFWADKRKGQWEAGRAALMGGAPGTTTAGSGGAGGRGPMTEDAYDAIIDYAAPNYRGLYAGAQRLAGVGLQAAGAVREQALSFSSGAFDAAGGAAGSLSKVIGGARHTAVSAADAATRGVAQTARGVYETAAGAVGR